MKDGDYYQIQTTLTSCIATNFIINDNQYADSRRYLASRDTNRITWPLEDENLATI